MTSAVVVGDPQACTVRLSDPQESLVLGVDFLAEMTGPGLRARTPVLGAAGLERFFTELADNWRGWEGTREWQSIERDLIIQARVDGRGHVSLIWTLRDSYQPEAWEARIAVSVEAGEAMSSLARAVTAFMQPQ